MAASKDDWIGRRAYALWETEGRPDGRGDTHWQQAATEYEMLEHTRASADGGELLEKLRDMAKLMREADDTGASPSSSTPVFPRCRNRR